MPRALKTAVKCAGAAGALLAFIACAEKPEAGSTIDRLVEENHKASEALVQVARDAAAKAGEQAQDAAHAARNAYDAAVGSGTERD